MSGKKFAALVKSSYTIPGDERSRTNPGHGYPEETVEYIQFLPFESEDEMGKWVASQTKYSFHSHFNIIQYDEVEVETKVVVKLKEHK